MSVRGKKTVHYQQVIIWAQDGMCCVEDKRKNGDVKIVSPTEMTARAKALGDAADIYPPTAQERIRDWAAANAIMEVVAEAIRQGDPTNQRTQEYFCNQRPHRSIWSQGHRVSQGGILLGSS